MLQVYGLSVIRLTRIAAAQRWSNALHSMAYLNLVEHHLNLLPCGNLPYQFKFLFSIPDMRQGSPQGLEERQKIIYDFIKRKTGVVNGEISPC